MDQRVTTWDVSELFMILDLSLCASYLPSILLYDCAIVMKRLRLWLRLLPTQSWNPESELFSVSMHSVPSQTSFHPAFLPPAQYGCLQSNLPISGSA